MFPEGKINLQINKVNGNMIDTNNLTKDECKKFAESNETALSDFKSYAP